MKHRQLFSARSLGTNCMHKVTSSAGMTWAVVCVHLPSYILEFCHSLSVHNVAIEYRLIAPLNGYSTTEANASQRSTDVDSILPACLQV